MSRWWRTYWASCHMQASLNLRGVMVMSQERPHLQLGSSGIFRLRKVIKKFLQDIQCGLRKREDE